MDYNKGNSEVNMPRLDDMIPQTPLEGPPLPSGVKVKWTDDPERVFRAIENYAASIRRPLAQELYQRGTQRYGPQSLSPQRIAEMGSNWFESQRRSVEGYRNWLMGKLP